MIKKAKQVKPFVKWVGGKRNVIENLLHFMPKEFNNYYEPFVGGGALFFELSSKLKNKVILSDTNEELIMAYNIIKSNPNSLIKLLEEHKVNHNQEYYYNLRNKEFKNELEIAARFIYLNKTGFNGMYRVNKKNKFNVPIGSYKNPKIVDKENILLCSSVLQNIEIRLEDYKNIIPEKGDATYFDPPYYPLNDTSHFTNYTKDGFNAENQIELKEHVDKLTLLGVKCLISNSNCDFIKDLWKSYDINFIMSKRSINCKKELRGEIKEVLIKNY